MPTNYEGIASSIFKNLPLGTPCLEEQTQTMFEEEYLSEGWQVLATAVNLLAQCFTTRPYLQ